MPNLPPKHGARRKRSSQTSKTKQRQSKRLYPTYSKQWRKERAIQLTHYPLCEVCESEGRLTPATEVDHINQRADRPEDYTPENYRSLCKSCHTRITFHGLPTK